MLDKQARYKIYEKAINAGIEIGEQRAKELQQSLGYLIMYNAELEQLIGEYLSYAMEHYAERLKEAKEQQNEALVKEMKNALEYLDDADNDVLLQDLVTNITYKIEQEHLNGESIDFKKFFQSVLPNELI